VFSRNVVLTPGRLAETVDYFMQDHIDAVCFDMETSGDNRGVPYCNSASWIGLSARGRVAVIPFTHPIGSNVVGIRKEPRQQANGIKMFKMPVYDGPPPQLDRAEVFEALKPVFWSDKVKIAHGMQFDLATSAKYYGGDIMPGPYCDTIVLRWLLDENRKQYKLKAVTKDVYGFAYDDEDTGKCVEKHPFSKVAHYLHCDVVYPLAEYYKLRPMIDDQDLGDVYDLEMALLPVLARVRLTGIRVDRKRLEDMRADLGPKVEQIEGDIYAAAGRKFNINAPRQKQEILYGPKDGGGQGLRPWKLTDGARERKKRDPKFIPCLYDWSTDADSLDTFVGNPVVDALLTYQEWYKLLHTYVLGYLGDPDAKDKPCRIHDDKIFADFVQYGTKTGRFSCREPNLQNVGRPDTELGKLIRGAFVADPGRKLIVADYGQIELVMLAHYLGQGKLFEGFMDGIDPHQMTAAMVLGKDPGDVTKAERQSYGKSINFAVVYGAGDNKVASMIGNGTTARQARQFLDRHESEFPEIYGFKSYVLDQCRAARPPHITTLFGRKRRVPGILSSERGMRMYSERQAFNSLIQGSSADIIKLAMTRLPDRMPEWMQLHSTVHDELVCSAPADLAEEGSEILLDAMTGPGIGDILRVPLRSDCAIVDCWSQAK
jgi:DNA polymerase I-like protein with 3'-5' exonuclease and polymerase domains